MLIARLRSNTLVRGLLTILLAGEGWGLLLGFHLTAATILAVLAALACPPSWRRALGRLAVRIAALTVAWARRVRAQRTAAAAPRPALWLPGDPR